MKQFMTDLCLVLLVICVLALFFDDNKVSQTMFQRSIDNFEETLSSGEVAQNQYVTIQDSSDNQVSSLLKTISQGCIHIIEFIATIFSNFVSLILTDIFYL
ncbi:hypothetical protein [Candidatus Stoquefichus sp. SB1]|jgi:hypothetical protein|uniref:hypothetical protein n=1 Tax=Candidatus Stoquefichus sp. SB1 TaxID=1658109 RepID=UPI00067EA737|nr:hypothetical protein [Candidatus Stoquefichus sp. SB1]